MAEWNSDARGMVDAALPSLTKLYPQLFRVVKEQAKKDLGKLTLDAVAMGTVPPAEMSLTTAVAFAAGQRYANHLSGQHYLRAFELYIATCCDRVREKNLWDMINPAAMARCPGLFLDAFSEVALYNALVKGGLKVDGQQWLSATKSGKNADFKVTLLSGKEMLLDVTNPDGWGVWGTPASALAPDTEQGPSAKDATDVVALGSVAGLQRDAATHVREVVMAKYKSKFAKAYHEGFVGQAQAVVAVSTLSSEADFAPLLISIATGGVASALSPETIADDCWRKMPGLGMVLVYLPRPVVDSPESESFVAVVGVLARPEGL